MAGVIWLIVAIGCVAAGPVAVIIKGRRDIARALRDWDRGDCDGPE